MPVVKINAIEVPAEAGPELEKRFAHRAHAVENSPGFLGFQLLRPVKGEDRYFVVTHWESEEAFQAWATGPAIEAHAGVRANPVATGASLHLISSYGARQDIRIHTDDGGWVDRFDVETQPPPVNSWHDVDAVLSKTGARYSYQVAKVDRGNCDPVMGTNASESLPLASI